MKLPSLEAVRFFEVVARHSSVKQAAAELNVTPGAVSQQLRKLEDFLGVALFERLPRGLSLTEAGRDYHQACQEALSTIGRATSRLMERGASVIVVSCTAGFAMQWLLPRLRVFLAEAPDIDVQVSTGTRLVDLAREGVHFAIRHGLGDYPGLRSEMLLDDALVPVCGPALAGGVESIDSARLLHDEHRDDWRLWAEAAGLPGLDSSRGIVFVDSNAVIEAALAGQGYALVRGSLVQEELATGRLRRMDAPALKTPLAYYLVYRPEALIDHDLRRFRDWLAAQAAA